MKILSLEEKLESQTVPMFRMEGILFKDFFEDELDELEKIPVSIFDTLLSCVNLNWTFPIVRPKIFLGLWQSFESHALLLRWINVKLTAGLARWSHENLLSFLVEDTVLLTWWGACLQAVVSSENTACFVRHTVGIFVWHWPLDSRRRKDQKRKLRFQVAAFSLEYRSRCKNGNFKRSTVDGTRICGKLLDLVPSSLFGWGKALSSERKEGDGLRYMYMYLDVCHFCWQLARWTVVWDDQKRTVVSCLELGFDFQSYESTTLQGTWAG